MSVNKCHPNLCSLFYQAEDFMNIDNFYALRKLEWQAYREHGAAMKIQSQFRKWLIRKNLDLLTLAAIKIQCHARGISARRRVAQLRQELEAQRLLQLRHTAATRIQARWRGYFSRKRYFDFRQYKSIREKNATLSRSVRSINELEALTRLGAVEALLLLGKPGAQALLLARSGDVEALPGTTESSTGINYPDASSSRVLTPHKSTLQTTVDRLLNSENAVEDILKLSPSRVSAVLDRIERMNEECLRRGFRPGRHSLQMAQKIQAEYVMKERMRESLDRLFPQFPSIPGLIRPKEEQVQRLKEAIAKFKCTLESEEDINWAKKHHLLRTYQRPGVLSDVTTHDLTPAERKLKELKFWKLPEPIRSQNMRVNPLTLAANSTGSDPPYMLSHVPVTFEDAE